MGRPREKSKYEFTTGQHIGMWKVVSGKLSGSPAKVEVQCVCGVIRPVDIYSLTNGRSTNCGCCRTARTSPVSKTVVARAITKAARSGESLTPAYLTHLFDQQQGTCAVSNASLTSTATVAPIDVHKGYVSGNVVWVSADISPMTNKHGVIGTLTMANALVSSHQSIFDRMGFTKGD